MFKLYHLRLGLPLLPRRACTELAEVLPRRVQNIVDQDLVRIFELLLKWDQDADRSL